MASRSFAGARLLGRTKKGMDFTGRGAVRKFSEEELAAETVYIHKMERGKMEKLKKKMEMEKSEKDKLDGSDKKKKSGEAQSA